MANARWQKKARERIERERDEAIGQLRGLGITPDAAGADTPAGLAQPRDEGDQAQASERQDLSFMTRERVADRINRLTAALERINEGTYGTCERCGREIERARLEALPDATRCLECQERAEREGEAPGAERAA
jgi:DnaK suppressor protein